MAPPELKADHLRMVPDFTGEVELLSEFISICESLVTHFYNQANPNDFQNIYLMSSLRAKIKGEAKINLSTYNITTWIELKTALLNTYGDKRDCYTLCVEMCNLTQGNESPFEFHAKIQKYINLHSSYLDTHGLGTQVGVKEYVAKLGLRTLLRNLKEPLGSLMRTRDPKDLNEALNMMTNDFQIEATKKPYQSYQNSNKSNKSDYKNNGPRYVPPPMKNQNFNNNYNNGNYNNNNNNNNNSNQQSNNFGQRNQSQNQNWSKPQSTFAKQGTNVWAPKATTSTYKPTPMSAMTTRLNNMETSQGNQVDTSDNVAYDQDNCYNDEQNYYTEDTDQDFRDEASETLEH
ncbi:hypothetical protein M8J77_014183 [Diaphorina citri]|nr:hypothetical protein M8J77_014183 [Diaphorina citri]